MSKWDIPDNINFAYYESPLQRIIGEAIETRIKQEENAVMSHITETIGYEIDKTELIKALNYDRDQYAKGYAAGLNADRWISVEDRLPEDASIGCLVTVMDTDIRTQNEFENLYPEFVGWDGETWNDSDGEPIPFEVIAWQELPKPYEKAGEEE